LGSEPSDPALIVMNLPWIGQQMVEAFPKNTVPRYLIRDRDKLCKLNHLAHFRRLHPSAHRRTLGQVGGVHHRYERRAA
jgi:hypothetical protein